MSRSSANCSGDPFEIVRGDVFFDLLNRAGSREG